MEGKRKLAIANDIQAGLPFDVIQKKHHACYGTVKSVAEEFGLTPHRTRRNALSDLEKRAIMDYYEQGWGTSWIAKEMGLKYDTVRNYKPGGARGAKKGPMPPDMLETGAEEESGRTQPAEEVELPELIEAGNLNSVLAYLSMIFGGVSHDFHSIADRCAHLSTTLRDYCILSDICEEEKKA